MSSCMCNYVCLNWHVMPSLTLYVHMWCLRGDCDNCGTSAGGVRVTNRHRPLFYRWKDSFISQESKDSRLEGFPKSKVAIVAKADLKVEKKVV